MQFLQQQVAAKLPRLHHPQRLGRIVQFWHDQRAKVLGLLELPQSFTQLTREPILAYHGSHVLHLSRRKSHVLQHADVGLCRHP